MTENTQKKLEKLSNLLIEYIFSTLGYLFVYSVNKYGLINPISLSGIFTLIICITVPPKYISFFLCSCLSSVMDNKILTNMGFILISAFFIVLQFRLILKYLPTIGGIPGLFAFVANLLNILIQWLISLSGIYEFNVNSFLYNLDEYSHLNVYIYVFGPIFTVVGCLGVHLVSERISKFIILSNKVMAYCIVTAFCSLFLTTFRVNYHSDNYGNPIFYGNIFAGFCNIGGLAGLTVKSKFYEYIKGYYFYHYVILGYICGWINISIIGFAVIGGKQGVIAFIGNFIYVYIFRIFEIKKSKNEEEVVETDKKEIAKDYVTIENVPDSNK
jgi:hypothetical protein